MELEEQYVSKYLIYFQQALIVSRVDYFSTTDSIEDQTAWSYTVQNIRIDVSSFSLFNIYQLYHVICNRWIENL